MSQSREANFEINLLPVISLLAVCISFLLVTAVWIHIGTMDVSQAVGPQTEDSKVNPPSLQIRMDGRGRMILTIKDAPNWRGNKQFAIGNAAGDVDWAAFDQAVSAVQSQLPELKTVLIFPSAEFRYRDLIKMMDGMKKKGLPDIGISPL
ncbi:MAG: biopolymer transporter ExbD [Bdellovibrionaceae bacterium]|nr:biopolymer transporter ExbD [Bdellovibrionales bacterium]MCB9083081.1 biopolymer transporter ExbD [Pseudobdellovibrionaceae bacterium]